MKEKITKGREKQQMHVKRQLLLAAAAFLLIAGLSVIVGNGFVRAEDSVQGASFQKKYYKSIELESGDTLWAIAEEYRGDKYDSIYSYIDEVMEINSLESTEIHAGQYLTVPYYDSL